MTRAGIEQLLYLMDDSFEQSRSQSLLANLASVGENDWHWLPAGGGRSIFDIVQHVGECKYVYDSHAFGDGSMSWLDYPNNLPTVDGERAPSAIIEWLWEGQRCLRTSIASLEDDDELLRPRKANWGRDYETRWLIKTMIQHDLYHGGEINHLRALRQGNDQWPNYG